MRTSTRTRRGLVLGFIAFAFLGCEQSPPDGSAAPRTAAAEPEAELVAPNAAIPVSVGTGNGGDDGYLLADLSGAAIPDAPARGSVHGVPFTVQDAKCQNGVLELRQGTEFFPDQSFVIFLFPDQGETGAGKTYRATPGDSMSMDTPHVHMKYMVEGKPIPETEMFMDEYALRLELGPAVGGTVKGSIYLCLPDDARSFVVGTFEAEMDPGFMKRAAQLALVAILGIASGCATSSTVTVATDAVFPPFHFVDDAGNLAGFDIDLARAALERAGERPRFVKAASYAMLFEGLVGGDYDVVAATTGITPERQERYGFTSPYFVTLLGVLVRAGEGEPRTPADLAGRAVAASAGTTSARAARMIEGARVLETARKADSLAALRSGEVDAVIIDEFEAVPFAREADDLDVLSAPAALESYGLVLRKGDDDLRRRLDDALAAMKADGTLAALRARHGLDRPADWPVRP